MRIRGLLLMVVFTAGCTSAGPDVLQVASGTIFVDTRLADVLIESYPAADVAIRAVGSGEAFELARRGEVDLLLVHEPDGIAELLADGIATEAVGFAMTRYVIAGPHHDPAGVGGSDTYAQALSAVASGRAPFVSRGDRSGTHQAELAFWADAGVEPSGDWYTLTGQGQAETIRVASELDAYLLTDIATYLEVADADLLAVLVDDDPDRWTTYRAVVLDGPGREAAGRFARFLAGPEARERIASSGPGWSPIEEDAP